MDLRQNLPIMVPGFPCLGSLYLFVLAFVWVTWPSKKLYSCLLLLYSSLFPLLLSLSSLSCPSSAVYLVCVWVKAVRIGTVGLLIVDWHVFCRSCVPLNKTQQAEVWDGQLQICRGRSDESQSNWSCLLCSAFLMKRRRPGYQETLHLFDKIFGQSQRQSDEVQPITLL